MNLVIHAHTLKNEPLPEPITGKFDTRGGTIGRAEDNTLVLPDVKRHVSRLHAEVSFSGGSFLIRNVGSGNPLMLNGRPLTPGDSAELNEGDTLLLGSYALHVTIDSATAGLELPEKVAPDIAAQVLTAGASPRAALAQALPATSADAVTALLPSSPASRGDVFEAFVGVATPPAFARTSPSDIEATPPSAASRVNRSSAVSDTASLLLAADVPLDSRLWDPFCEGAGISMPLPQGLTPDLMRTIGLVLRHTVDGTRRLVAEVSLTQQALHAPVSVSQPNRNNPLRFSPDSSSAIERLLRPPARGFMPGPEAVVDAMSELLAHAASTRADMRDALSSVLRYFEPEQLEAKLGDPGVVDTLLPMNRSAKLWDLYREHHLKVASEAEKEFHELLGKAFARAYEDELSRANGPSGP